MPLPKGLEAKIRERAEAEGFDADDAIEQATARYENRDAPSADRSTGKEAPTKGGNVDQPKLFMYLLPFVTVAEVRRVWLQIDAPFPGDGEVAAAWAAKISGPAPAPAAPVEPVQ